MKIVYLPLDSRPCNYRFPVQLLQMAGAECIVPPLQDMDFFTTPSDFHKIETFLSTQTIDADTLIVSIDQLIYGSLLASRQHTLDAQMAQARLGLLTALKAANPALTIYAFSVIMRTSISTLKADDLKYYEAFTAYSQAVHRAQAEGDAQAQQEADALEAFIPDALMSHYRAVRQRNHQINQDCIMLCHTGVIDNLLLLQEDSQPYGLHKLEQEALSHVIHEFNCYDSVTMHNGTDEGGCLCAAKATNKPCKLGLQMLGDSNHEFVAKYEDRPFASNIQSHCHYAGITLTQQNDADYILTVLHPIGHAQTDVPSPDKEPEMDKQCLAALASQFEKAGDPSGRTGLLDVYYGNGGAKVFMDSIARTDGTLPFSSYAAWNTASNALGTILAQLKLGTGHPDNLIFTIERILDDLVYQADVRFQLQALLQEKYGEDILHLTDKARADSHLMVLMEKAAASCPLLKGYHIEATYTLPWPRTFEVSVEVSSVSPW